MHRLLLYAATAPAAFAAWQTFTPSAFTIQRMVGQLGFATEVEWQYYEDGEKKKENHQIYNWFEGVTGKERNNIKSVEEE